MKIEIEITRAKFYVLVSCLVLLILGLTFVSAYNANFPTSSATPMILGHSPDEIVGDLKCGAGEYITINQSGWSCIRGQSSADFDYGLSIKHVNETVPDCTTVFCPDKQILFGQFFERGSNGNCSLSLNTTTLHSMYVNNSGACVPSQTCTITYACTNFQ